MDQPASCTVVSEVPQHAEDTSSKLIHPGLDDQVPTAQDQDQVIQEDKVDFSHLFSEGNANFGFANLQTGAYQYESDDAASNYEEEYTSEDDGDAFSDASMDGEDEEN